MKRCFFVLLIFVKLLVLSPVLFASPTETMPVIILNDANKEPFTTEKNDGFLNVLLIEAFKRIGYKMDTVRLPAERGLLSANEGIVDGEVNRIAGMEKTYKNLRRVPEKLRDSDFCVLSKDESIVNTPEELEKHAVGYVKGWKIYEKMMSGSNHVITADNPPQLFRLLQLNRIDIALYTCLQGFYLAKEFNVENIKVLKPELVQRGMFLYLNKRYEHLLPSLTQVLKDIKKEGLYDKYYREKILSYYGGVEKQGL